MGKVRRKEESHSQRVPCGDTPTRVSPTCLKKVVEHYPVDIVNIRILGLQEKPGKHPHSGLGHFKWLAVSYFVFFLSKESFRYSSWCSQGKNNTELQMRNQSNDILCYCTVLLFKYYMAYWIQLYWTSVLWHCPVRLARVTRSSYRFNHWHFQVIVFSIVSHILLSLKSARMHSYHASLHHATLSAATSCTCLHWGVEWCWWKPCIGCHDSPTPRALPGLRKCVTPLLWCNSGRAAERGSWTCFPGDIKWKD